MQVHSEKLRTEAFWRFAPNTACTARMACLAIVLAQLAAAQTPATAAVPASNGVAYQDLVQQYCAVCHDDQQRTGGVTLKGLKLDTVGGKQEVLERVLRKVKARQMPPPGMPRPEPAVMAGFSKWLESSLDAEAAAHPNPGRPAIHRLNRAEYSNAIRDIFALDTNPGSLLPVDDSGYGFDNIGDVLSVSPALLDRYLVVAKRVARLVVGDPTIKPVEEAFGPRRDARGQIGRQTRMEWMGDDLPFNSAGGLAVHYYFPLDAEYVLRIRTGDPNANGPTPDDDKPLEVRLAIRAGSHTVGLTFPAESLEPEILPAVGGRRGGGAATPAKGTPVPLDLRLDGAQVQRFELRGSGGEPPRIGQLVIAGPYQVTGRGETPSRARIFVCRPATSAQETPCAQKILTTLTRRAYRRPVTDADVRPLVEFYRSARREEEFDFAIQRAIQAMLVSPNFLFRVEAEPADSSRATAYRISDVELASRLSFFLWSSVPDDQLLDVAEKGRLSDPGVLHQQVRRMLEDPKSDALVNNFVGQWLYVRNLATVRPDPVLFASFDESLRASFQKETELFFGSILRENRSVLELLSARYSFLNERLAEHYGIRNIYGSQFRRVALDDPNRGGLLGQGSILTVTSYPDRTSVVQRGKWILENLLGTPPPPPPANVPPLEATTKGSRSLSLRQAMEQHRADPTCAGCHARMDPLGFALENYDAIGRWRSKEAGKAIDASGKLPDGTRFDGPGGLKEILTTVRREEFVSTVTEKLLTYALGRGVEYYDQPAIRAILHESERNDYRLDDLIEAVVDSTPFQMRRSAGP